MAGDAVRGGAGWGEAADMAVRATLVGTPGWVPTPHPRTAVGDGWSADRGQWGVEEAGARADRDAVESGDHDRAIGSAPLGAQLAEPRIVAVLVALACSAPLGDRMGAAGAVSDLWGPPRPRLVARWEHDRLRLLDPKNESVVAAEVDPEIRFGQPRIPGTGIPTAIIYERWLAGEAAAQLAAVYERPVAEVTSAISYEESSRAA